MRRIWILLGIAAVAFAQKPPKKIDEALRARISEFYQDHVTEQYRKAEQLVAEDARDMFYVREKPKYESFEIANIEYLDHFRKAKVTVTVAQYGHAQGFTGTVLKTPSLSYWKLEHGKWFWYVDPEELKRVGFGPSANAGTKPAPGTPEPQVVVASTPDVAMGKVDLDKTAIVVKKGAIEKITITNHAMGTMTLSVYQVLPDVKVTLDKTSLNRGEQAIATITCGDFPHQGEVQFMVMPTGEILSVATKRE
jgi:hypothetical protein